MQSPHALYGILYGAYTACLGFYTEPTRRVRDPIQSLCMIPHTEPTRPVWDPAQNLHALYGVLYRARTACMISCLEPTRPVGDPIQSLYA
eukprot:9502410-Pyramimonas_sp.AAC.1